MFYIVKHFNFSEKARKLQSEALRDQHDTDLPRDNAVTNKTTTVRKKTSISMHIYTKSGTVVLRKENHREIV